MILFHCCWFQDIQIGCFPLTNKQIFRKICLTRDSHSQLMVFSFFFFSYFFVVISNLKIIVQTRFLHFYCIDSITDYVCNINCTLCAMCAWLICRNAFYLFVECRFSNWVSLHKFNGWEFRNRNFFSFYIWFSSFNNTTHINFYIIQTFLSYVIHFWRSKSTFYIDWIYFSPHFHQKHCN